MGWITKNRLELWFKQIFLSSPHDPDVSRDSEVGIVTDYGLDNRWVRF
jgi:hypothetical protein